MNLFELTSFCNYERRDVQTSDLFVFVTFVDIKMFGSIDSVGIEMTSS